MGDLLVRAKSIWTLDDANPRAEAIGVRDGTIVAVGAAGEVRGGLSRPRELDLGSACVVPGLIDAHGHLRLLGQKLREVDLFGARSVDEVARRVARRAESARASEWIRGRGWDQNLFEHQEFPHRGSLDRQPGGNPVLLERVDAHAALLNSAALQIAGISRDTPDPPGGRILRDGSGEPTGVLLDAAMDLAQRCLPKPTTAELEAMLHHAASACARVGLVEVHEAGLDREGFEALQALAARNELPIRVYAMARWGEPRFAQTLQQGPVIGQKLTMRAVKFFLDGALGSRGAALFEDYEDAPGERGLLTGPADLVGALCQVMSRGFQPACHAIGDRANALALDSIEQAQRLTGRRDLRPRIEHVQVLREADLPRFAKLGVIASMQPIHAVSDRGWACCRLGTRRLEWAYAWKLLSASGARLAMGSDFPIEEPNPILGLVAGGESRDTVLHGFTSGAAYASFEESRAGRIAPGFRADLSAFDRDVLCEPPEKLKDARAIMTMVAGEWA